MMIINPSDFYFSFTNPNIDISAQLVDAPKPSEPSG